MNNQHHITNPHLLHAHFNNFRSNISQINTTKRKRTESDENPSTPKNRYAYNGEEPELMINQVYRTPSNSSVDSYLSNECIYTKVLQLSQPANDILRYLTLPPKPTEEDIKKFVLNQNHVCIINLRSLTVGQKSYKSEKRFLCPATIVELRNKDGWENYKDSIKKIYPELVKKYRENGGQNIGELRVIGEANCSDIVGVAKAENIPVLSSMPLQFDNTQSLALLKTIYFPNNEDSKAPFKSSSIKATLMTSCGIQIGSFQSECIRVISKPSKKTSCIRQGPNDHLFIKSCSTVALFTKTKNQIAQTKYVTVNENKFTASSSRWDCLEIYLTDEQMVDDDPDNFSYQYGNLTYGSVVKITSLNTGISLPLCRIVRPGKDNVIALANAPTKEPVCQLQKVCFQLVDSPISFLCLNNDTMTTNDVIIGKGLNKEYVTVESCIFQVVSVVQKEFKFYCSTGITPIPISPCPIVKSYIPAGGTSDFRVEFLGTDLGSVYEIWIGLNKLEFFIKSSEHLVACFKEHQYTWASNDKSEDSNKEYLFIRQDGVIYPSGIFFTSIT